MGLLINLFILLGFGLWIYAIVMDYSYYRPLWAFVNFIIFPIGIARGLYLALEGY